MFVAEMSGIASANAPSVFCHYVRSPAQRRNISAGLLHTKQQTIEFIQRSSIYGTKRTLNV
jgi:hypothetical protein